MKKKAWVNQHINDPYVIMAQKDGYRSRAAYKLLELDQEFNFFNNINIMVDLGSAPGSWLQVARKKTKALIIGLDILPIEPIAGIDFIQGDFTEDSTINTLMQKIDKVDLVLSDMAPNLSGIKNVDQARSTYLVELALEFCQKYLKDGGRLLIKAFNGSEFNNIVKKSREIFAKVQIKKPKSSRGNSCETFLVCLDKKTFLEK